MVINKPLPIEKSQSPLMHRQNIDLNPNIRLTMSLCLHNKFNFLFDYYNFFFFLFLSLVRRSCVVRTCIKLSKKVNTFFFSTLSLNIIRTY